MQKIVVFLSLLTFFSLAFAGERTKGKGKFKASEDDDQNFIQKQLIHEGFKNIISKELAQQGLNTDLFWEKYQQGLLEFQQPLEERLREKYRINDKSSAKQKIAFQKALRKKKLVAARGFGGINNIIRRWVLIKISRSQKFPQNRYIQLEGEVDTSALNRLYYKFVKGKSTSDYGSLFVRVNFDLSGFSYSDIGIENENEFDSVIVDKWVEWFSLNKPLNISNVAVLNEDYQGKLDSLLVMPSDDMLNNVPEEFVSSLLLDLNVEIENLDAKPEINAYEYQISGRAFLKNLQSNVDIASYKISKTTKRYRISPNISQANLLANHVYHLIKDHLPKVNRDIKNLTPISAIQRIQMQGFKNTTQLYKFIDLVRSRGVKYSVRTKVDSITRDMAEVIIYYDGELGQIKSLLNGLKAAKTGLLFDVIDTPKALGIKFKSENSVDKL